MSEGQQGKPAIAEDGPRPLGSGRTFGRYETFASLGSGGMADVYLAVARGPKGFQKLMVVKTLKREFSTESSFVEMFLDEARLAAKLNHPNVVHTQEVGESDGAYYMAMEFLEGQPFNRLIDHLGSTGEPFRPELVARMISDALAGLHYAHELRDYDGHPLGIIHRDISPQNLFVTYEGQVKVVDFGIAKAASSSIQTEVGVLKGKLAYMAPEQAMGDVIDRRADLYAMGIVLWEGLTLRPLARGESAPSRLARILNNDVPRVASVIKDFDPHLDDIVTKALDRDPAQRFQTAAEMRDALEGWLGRSGTLVRQEELGRRVSEMFKDARADVQRKVKAQMAALDGAETRISGLPPEAAVAPSVAKERCSAMNSSATLPLGSQRVPVAAIPSTPGPPRSGRRTQVLAAIAVALALGATAVWWGARARSAEALRTLAATEGGATSTSHGVALTDFPPPKTDNPSAAAAYADALRGLRDGNVATAEAELRSAVEFDPRMGAAYLRLGLLERVYSDTGRSWLEKATTLRDQLSDRDRALLRAAQAVRDDEQRTGAEGLAESLPHDPEALVWSASWFWSLDLDASRKALALYRQAIALDPLFALGYARLSGAQSVGSGTSCTNPGDPELCDGHPEAAIQTADRCLEKVPGSIACLVARADGHNLLGQCDALEKDAKSLLGTAPSAPQGYSYMMVALMNQGASVSALEQLAERHQAAFPESERASVRLRNRVRLSLYTGDFPAAERALAELERSASGSTAETNHYAAFMEMLVAEEEGATARAIADAQDYYGKMAAWSLDLGKTYARAFALAELVRAGKMTANESRARMDEWARASVARLPAWRQAHRWVMRHAPVETPDEAREAMSVAPTDLLPYYVSLPYFRGTLGRIVALAGDSEKALPYLKDEARWCGAQFGYDNVYDAFHWLRQMQDRLILGQVLERANEREGACAQYGIILDRWGHAKPKSVTADKARERAKALGCTP